MRKSLASKSKHRMTINHLKEPHHFRDMWWPLVHKTVRRSDWQGRGIVNYKRRSQFRPLWIIDIRSGRCWLSTCRGCFRIEILYHCFVGEGLLFIQLTIFSTKKRMISSDALSRICAGNETTEEFAWSQLLPCLQTISSHHHSRSLSYHWRNNS